MTIIDRSHQSAEEMGEIEEKREGEAEVETEVGREDTGDTPMEKVGCIEHTTPGIENDVAIEADRGIGITVEEKDQEATTEEGKEVIPHIHQSEEDTQETEITTTGEDDL